VALGIPGSRRGRALVGAAVLVIVAAAVGIPVVLTSDWWTLSYAVAAQAPRALSPTEPAGTVHRAWSATGTPSAGSPVGPAAVVTADRHEIAGRDPRTGAIKWHYRRGNADLCSWVVANSSAVAVFRNGTSCSDITAFDPDTGSRRWYRNADLGAHIRLVAAPNVVVATEKAGLTAFYTDGGGDAWSFSKPGCTMGPVAGGDVGVVVVADCGRRGDSLIALDSYSGDKKWTVAAGGENPQLLGADNRVTLLSRIGGRATLSVFSSTGHAVGSISGHGLTDAARQLPTGAVADGRLVAFDGNRVFALALDRPRIAWSAPATGPADVEGSAALVPQNTGFAEYAVATGQVVRRVTATVPSALTALARIGSAIVAVSPEATTAFD
jgi:hypothetical protein